METYIALGLILLALAYGVYSYIHEDEHHDEIDIHYKFSVE